MGNILIYTMGAIYAFCLLAGIVVIFNDIKRHNMRKQQKKNKQKKSLNEVNKRIMDLANLH